MLSVHQLLEEWTAPASGAASLPLSKLGARGGTSFPILDKARHEITISFEAAWSRTGAKATHLQSFAAYHRKVVRAIVGGLGPSSTHGPPCAGARPRRIIRAPIPHKPQAA